MSSGEADLDVLLGRATDEYCRLLRRGHTVSIDEFVSRYSSIAAELRDVLPLIDRIERASERAGATSEQVGRTVGDFRLLRTLGQGGMGVVYEAQQISLERRVAIKFLSRERQRDPVAVNRFRLEGLAMAQLRHPNIVPVLAVGNVGDEAFIAMQFIDGVALSEVLPALRAHATSGAAEEAGLLGEVIRLLRWSDLTGASTGQAGVRASGPASSSEKRVDELRYGRNVAALGLQAARAIGHAHRHGILHRDVKPSNFLLDASGNLWLTDFGLCKTDAANLTQTGEVIGTLRYLAPERLRGEGDLRSYVYGLGITLYELLTLRPPFAGEEQAQLVRSILERSPEPLSRVAPELPRDLRVIVETATHRDAQQRYASTDEFAADLQAFLEHRPIVPHRSSLRYVMNLAYRRHRVRILTVALAVLLVVLFTTLFLIRLDDLRRESLDHLSLAERRLLDYRRIGDARRLEQLIAAARGEHPTESLGPIARASIAGYESWLAEANELASRLPSHRAAIERLTAEIARLEAGGRPDERGFRREEIQWQLESIQQHCDRLDQLFDPDPQVGDVASVRERVRLAGWLESETLGESSAAAWKRAIDSIADPEECPAYGGLVLTPQLGLIPLWRNPETGFWEFLHRLSGDAPIRSPSGKLLIEPETGCVLVLLPGGTFTMGADNPATGWWEGSENYDSYSKYPEGPAHDVTLDPFFVGKCEMTFAQWQRIVRSCPGDEVRIPQQGWDPTCPVDGIHHARSLRHLDRVGLDLPTEAQWEYAARGGTHSVWWCGDDVSDLQRAGNVSDASDRANVETRGGQHPWDDGYRIHAPVGSFESNPFGLHDVIGNIRELCKDHWAPYSSPVREGDGLRLSDDARHVARGGVYHEHGERARSASRYRLGVTGFGGLGLRAVRPVCQ